MKIGNVKGLNEQEQDWLEQVKKDFSEVAKKHNVQIGGIILLDKQENIIYDNIL